MADLIFFDLETGGLTDFNPDIQLAAVAVDFEFNEIASFERKIQFGLDSADPEALKMNHYDPEVWAAQAIPRAQCVREFAAFLSLHAGMEMISKRTGAPYKVARLAGHNVAAFDMPRLKRMFGSAFMPAHPQPLDSLQLALWHFRGKTERPENNKLGTLAAFLGLQIGETHSALADVRLNVDIVKCMLGVGKDPRWCYVCDRRKYDCACVEAA